MNGVVDIPFAKSADRYILKIPMVGCRDDQPAVSLQKGAQVAH
jgi:hypothetical protein